MYALPFTLTQTSSSMPGASAPQIGGTRNGIVRERGLLHGCSSKESSIKTGRQLRLASLLLGVHEEGLQPYQGAIPVLGFSREESGSPECKCGLCS